MRPVPFGQPTAVVPPAALNKHKTTFPCSVSFSINRRGLDFLEGSCTCLLLGERLEGEKLREKNNAPPLNASVGLQEPCSLCWEHLRKRFSEKGSTEKEEGRMVVQKFQDMNLLEAVLRDQVLPASGSLKGTGFSL